MQLQNIKPGTRVNLKISKQPTNAAARKTLIRLLSKDPTFKGHDERLRKVRREGYSPKRRGGRLYGGRMVKTPIVEVRPGVSGTITATLDVLTDLGSVSRFVEVTPA